MSRNPQPVHVAGTPKGEEQALHGHEPGRDPNGKSYRTARDSTGINADKREPIIPGMANIPPA
jgi:hypothetical protein